MGLVKYRYQIISIVPKFGANQLMHANDIITHSSNMLLSNGMQVSSFYITRVTFWQSNRIHQETIRDLNFTRPLLKGAGDTRLSLKLELLLSDKFLMQKLYQST